MLTLLLLTAYALPYQFLRGAGSYGITQSGKIRYRMGLTASGLERWNPKNR